MKGKVVNAGETEGIVARHFDELDKTLLEHLGKAHILMPDIVRGKYETLESAVLHNNWPTLKEAKGKFVFVLDDSGSKRDMYISGHPSLRGRNNVCQRIAWHSGSRFSDQKQCQSSPDT